MKAVNTKAPRSGPTCVCVDSFKGCGILDLTFWCHMHYCTPACVLPVTSVPRHLTRLTAEANQKVSELPAELIMYCNPPEGITTLLSG